MTSQPAAIRCTLTVGSIATPDLGNGRLRDSPVISIVDDDACVRLATTKFLRLHGYCAEAFASAEEFLRSGRVDSTECLIADIRMPGMSGLELQEHLIAEGRRVPTVFITAVPEERCRARALAARAASFLSKPFNGRTLISCVEEALGRPGERAGEAPRPGVDGKQANYQLVSDPSCRRR